MRSSPSKQANAKRYYEDHREEMLAQQATYNANHRDDKRAYDAAYHSAHRDERLAYAAAHYQARTADRRVFLDKAKAGVGCKDCSTSLDLTFHHREKDTKRYNIADMLRMPWSEIMTEVWKCDVLCRSCHTKRHHQEDRLLVV